MAFFRALVVLALLTPGLAHAEDDPRWLNPRVQLAARTLAGSLDAADLSGFGVGAGIGVEVVVTRVSVLAEFDTIGADVSDADVEDGPEFSARSQKVRVGARFHLMDFQLREQMRGGLTTTLGAGYERMTIAGREQPIRRDFVTFGWGSPIAFRSKRTGDNVFIVHFGARLDLARAPRIGKATRPPSCVGPCDDPTVTNPIDVALSMGLALSWGRI